jgi:hypothetical protein
LFENFIASSENELFDEQHEALGMVDFNGCEKLTNEGIRRKSSS